MVKLSGRPREIESREQTDDQEQYERIGEREEKARGKLLPVAVGSRSPSRQHTRRIGKEQIDGIDSQHHRPHKLEQALMALDEPRHKRQAERRQQAIYKIAQRRAYAREESRETPAAQRTLNHKHPYRPHRSRYQQPYQGALEQYDGQIYHSLQN